MQNKVEMGPNEIEFRTILNKMLEDGLQNIHIDFGPEFYKLNRESRFGELIKIKKAIDESSKMEFFGDSNFS